MRAARVIALVRKEWREITRDRMFFSLAFVLPAMLMLVFAYGNGRQLEHVPMAAVDHDRTDTSRRYVERFANTVYFDHRGLIASEHEAVESIARGEVRMVVVIPEDFERHLLAGRSATVQSFVDGSFSTSTPARTLQGYLESINAAATSDLQVDFVARRLGLSPDRGRTLLTPIQLQVRYLYNPQLEMIWASAPALLMFILNFVAPLLMALGVVREKECGSILNIDASTVTRAEFLTGKLLPNVAIACGNTFILWVLAVGWFQVPFKGSLTFFAAASLLYAVAAPSIGLIISLLVQSQTTAMIISIVLGVLVGSQYSGMYIPVESLHGMSWLIAHLFPAMYFNELTRDVFLKGLGPADLWVETCALAFFATALPLVAWLLFHKRRRR